MRVPCACVSLCWEKNNKLTVRRDCAFWRLVLRARCEQRNPFRLLPLQQTYANTHTTHKHTTHKHAHALQHAHTLMHIYTSTDIQICMLYCSNVCRYTISYRRTHIHVCRHKQYMNIYTFANVYMFVHTIASQCNTL